MNLHRLIKKQDILIENAKLKEENERLKKLVFSNDDEKDLISFSILTVIENAVNKFEKTEDPELKEEILDEMLKLAKIFASFK